MLNTGPGAQGLSPPGAPGSLVAEEVCEVGCPAVLGSHQSPLYPHRFPYCDMSHKWDHTYSMWHLVTGVFHLL